MKKDETALAIRSEQTFQLAETAPQLDIDPELLAALTDEDEKGFEQGREFLPIVSIRQKDLKDDRGKAAVPAGGFRIYDGVSEANGLQITDVDGERGLLVSFLADQNGRVYFEKLDDKHPKCRSLDGEIGVGEPGGHCKTCPLGQFKPDGTRPPCQAQINVLAYDHNMQACYVLRLGPSAIKPYSMFVAGIKRIKQGGRSLPVPSVVVSVTTDFVQEPKDHYIPHFEIAEVMKLDLFNQMRDFRSKLTGMFGKTVEVDDTADETEPIDTEHEEVADGPTNDHVDPDTTPF